MTCSPAGNSLRATIWLRCCTLQSEAQLMRSNQAGRDRTPVWEGTKDTSYRSRAILFDYFCEYQLHQPTPCSALDVNLPLVHHALPLAVVIIKVCVTCPTCIFGFSVWAYGKCCKIAGCEDKHLQHSIKEIHDMSRASVLIYIARSFVIVKRSLLRASFATVRLSYPRLRLVHRPGQGSFLAPSLAHLAHFNCFQIVF